MADLSQVRVALAQQIAAKAFPVLRMEPQPFDQINPPCGIIMPARNNVAKYGITLGEGLIVDGGVPFAPAEFNLDVVLVVSRASTIERVETTLDQWLGFENVPGQTVSVAMAIALDPTLGGVVDYCEASTVGSYGPLEYNGTMYFGARINCTVSTQLRKK